uniref:Uncharacterized protein n=1 Tax=Ditylenchus dipsaci TaxID=166011 RepID=A0A915DEJ5_9BILA
MTLVAIVLVVAVAIFMPLVQACIPTGSSSGGCNCAQNSGCGPCVAPPPPPPVCNDCSYSRDAASASGLGCGRPQCTNTNYAAPVSAPILPLPPPPPPPIYSPPPINLPPLNIPFLTIWMPAPPASNTLINKTNKSMPKYHL